MMTETQKEAKLISINNLRKRNLLEVNLKAVLSDLAQKAYDTTTKRRSQMKENDVKAER